MLTVHYIFLCMESLVMQDAMTAGKEVGGGQDAMFDGRSSSSLRTRCPLVPTRGIGVMQDDTGRTLKGARNIFKIRGVSMVDECVLWCTHLGTMYILVLVKI
jgi:hypothetical protein